MKKKILITLLEIILPIMVALIFTVGILLDKIVLCEDNFDKNALSVICTIIITVVVTSFTNFCSSNSKAAMKLSKSNKVLYFIMSTLVSIGVNIVTVIFIVFNFSIKIQMLFFIYSICSFWNYIIIISFAFYYDLKNLNEDEEKKQEILEKITVSIIKIAKDITRIKNN